MSTQDHARQFAQIPFLSHLEPRAIELIAFSGETRIMRRGEVLFRKGDAADAGFVVLSGRLALDPCDGRDPVEVTSGSLVGEMALLVETERKATATVVEPSGILRIPRPLFHRVLKENPGSAVRLRAFCARRLKDFARELEAVGFSMEPGASSKPAGEQPEPNAGADDDPSPDAKATEKA